MHQISISTAFQTGEWHEPQVITLCGSTRFFAAFESANMRLTIAGYIVLSIGAHTASDPDLIENGTISQEDYDRLKPGLDALHLAKIDLSDAVMILNVGGYVGESTARELAYARMRGKQVIWLTTPQTAQEGDLIATVYAKGDRPERLNWRRYWGEPAGWGPL